jgi:hypothetical protein
MTDSWPVPLCVMPSFVAHVRFLLLLDICGLDVVGHAS